MSVKTVAKTSITALVMGLSMIQLQSVLVNQAQGEAPLTAPLTSFVTPTPTSVPLTAPVQVTPTPTQTPPLTAPQQGGNSGGNNGGSNTGGNNGGGGGGSSSNGGGSNNNGGDNVCRDERPKSAPIILSARKTGANQVTLSWRKGWAPFNGFIISYSNKRGTTQYTTEVGNTTSATVNGLNGNTTYFFRIQAKNGCVFGDYSRELSVRTYGGKILSAKTIKNKKSIISKSKKSLKVVKPIILKKKK